jgi:hypothetical protein
VIYTDEENIRWWEALTEQGRLDVLATMIDKMEHSDFAMSLSTQYARKIKLSARQIAAIRKWARD